MDAITTAAILEWTWVVGYTRFILIRYKRNRWRILAGHSSVHSAHFNADAFEANLQGKSADYQKNSSLLSDV